MMHYRMGTDSAPNRIDAIRGVLADDLDLAEVLGGLETRRNSRTVTGRDGSKSADGYPRMSLGERAHFALTEPRQGDVAS